MAKPMSPSSFNPMTSGQMSKFYELLVAALRKAGLPSEPTQGVLERHGGIVAEECVSLLRRRVEAASDMIVRRVRVDRSRSPQEMLDATGRTQHANKTVVAAIPQGEGEEMDVYFFPCKRYTPVEEVAKMLEERDLKTDVYAQAAVNEADPAFADDHPNGTQWQDKDGNYCYATFDRWDDERHVIVYRSDGDWGDGWWFAGVRK